MTTIAGGEGYGIVPRVGVVQIDPLVSFRRLRSSSVCLPPGVNSSSIGLNTAPTPTTRS